MPSPLPESIRDAAHKAAGCEEVGVGMECFTHSTDWTPEGCPVALETARAVMVATLVWAKETLGTGTWPDDCTAGVRGSRRELDLLSRQYGGDHD